jgi:hypothetical protein
MKMTAPFGLGSIPLLPVISALTEPRPQGAVRSAPFSATTDAWRLRYRSIEPPLAGAVFLRFSSILLEHRANRERFA